MIRTKIFIDSSFWLAFFNQEDALHQKALSFSQEKKFSLSILVTADYVIDETLTRLKKKVDAKAASLFYEALQRKIKEGGLTFFLTTQEVFDKAYEIFKKNPIPKSFSLTDAVVVAQMRAHKIGVLLTFDQDFKKIKPKTQVLP